MFLQNISTLLVFEQGGWVSTFADRDEAVGKQREEHVDKVQRSPAVMPPGVLGSWKAGDSASGGEVERVVERWREQPALRAATSGSLQLQQKAGLQQGWMLTTQLARGAFSFHDGGKVKNAHHSQRCVFRPWTTMRPFLFQGEVLSHTLPFT